MYAPASRSEKVLKCEVGRRKAGARERRPVREMMVSMGEGGGGRGWEDDGGGEVGDVVECDIISSASWVVSGRWIFFRVGCDVVGVVCRVSRSRG